MTVTDDLAPWAVANEAKMQQAQARNAALARQALAKLSDADIPADWRRVAVVVTHGDKTWKQVGDALGMTGSAAHSLFRRMLVKADLR